MFGDAAGWMGVGMWFFWILVILIFVVMIRAFTSSGTMPEHQHNPLDILKARYARGEIDDEEFEQHQRNLEK